MQFNFAIEEELSVIITKFNTAFETFFNALKSEINFPKNDNYESRLLKDERGFYIAGILTCCNRLQATSIVTVTPKTNGLCVLQYSFKGSISQTADTHDMQTGAVLAQKKKIKEYLHIQ